MCGRVALKHYKWDRQPDFLPRSCITHFDLQGIDWRFNVAPTLTIPILRTTAEGTEAIGARWWLVPRAITDIKSWKYSTFLARTEEMESKRTFAEPWERGQRCVIPVAAAYEWNREQEPSQPYAITRRDETWMLLGGLWEEGPTGVSCAMLTMKSNDLFRPIHNRMPLAFSDEDTALAWLNPDVAPEEARAMMRSWDPSPYQAYPVSRFVSSTKNEGAECMEPLRESTNQVDYGPLFDMPAL
ncbi:MAG: SOS response-associated peptidase [Gemmatimonadaceae bacterium]|nr:SOS response-associated peptidase [Gemmatimonadaceae bacterium]